MNPYNVKGNGRRRPRLLNHCPMRARANRCIATGPCDPLPQDAPPSTSKKVIAAYEIVWWLRR